MDLVKDTAVALTVGPLMSIDGVTRLDALAAGDVTCTLFKAGGAGAALALSGSNWVNRGNGYYSLSLTPATLGELRIDLVATGMLAYWEDHRVVSNDIPGDVAKVKAAVYDSAGVSGNVITLSNGATQTLSETGLVTEDAA